MSQPTCPHLSWYHFSDSDSTIFQNNFFHCFNVFICCWRAAASRARFVIGISSDILEELVPFINIFLVRADSLCATVNISSILEYLIPFLTQIWCKFFDPFFFIAENCRAHQNTSNLCICQKQTKYNLHLKLCTDFWDECTNMK